MKIKWEFLAIFVIFLILSACSSSSKYPVPCPAPPIPAEEAGENTVVFTIRNRTCTSINAMNIAADNCYDYGVNQLNEQKIPSGWEMSIKVIPGRYDVMIEECTGESFELTNIDLRESYTLTYSDPKVDDPANCKASVTVVNNSNSPICHMWIASPNSSGFGMNWLSEGDQIAPGGSRQFVVDENTYDIKAEDCEFDQLRVEFDVPVSSHITWEVPEP